MPRRTRSSGASNPGTSPKRLRRSARLASARAGRDAALGGADQTGRRIVISDQDFIDKNQALKDIDDTEDTALKAYELNQHKEENREAHHTNDYEIEDLIVRRGQEFTLSITFNREYNKDADTIIVQLTKGARPQESKDTLLRLTVGHTDPPSTQDWHAVYRASDDKTVKVGVIPASDAIIGRYRTFVETTTQGDDEQTFSHRREFEEGSFVVLFNAWCKDDSVYMEDSAERDEYVLNDQGRIWMGTQFDNYGKPWNFGQFEDVVLEAALFLLEKSELSEGGRSNPGQIARTISALANSSDEDNGVLTGRWTDEYPKDCTLPWSWMGSVAILDQYMKTKKAVEFGQCWVFSGLVTTLLRTLGLPTRSVTNFESAHDSDGSVTIDYHWNEDDDPEDAYNDSVWNFHVWNESYFKRPDLPEGYDGWQAHDSTPQEASEGVMRCGPASVQAIKEGNIYLRYDAPFIFAEVNGDKIHWLISKDGSMKVLGKETNAVGHKISTKAVGSNRCKILTWDYKYKEGSPEERAAVRRAFRYSSRKEHRVYDVPEPDVTFELMAPNSVTLGDPFTLKVVTKNTSDESRNVAVRLTCVSSYYTGVPSERIGTNLFNVQLDAGAEKTSEMEVTPEMYFMFLKPESMVTIYMKGRVIENKRAYARTHTFQVLKPDLDIEVPETIRYGETFSINVKFQNPLTEKLTGCVFHIEASKMTKPRTIPYKKAIGPQEEMTFTIGDLCPMRAGNREIYVNFSCNQMSGVTGAVEVYVAYGTR